MTDLDCCCRYAGIVLEIRGDQIKIGISAPKDVPIYRKEVYLQIQQENEAAISADGLDALNNLLD